MEVDLSELASTGWTIKRSDAMVELILSREEIVAAEFGESVVAGMVLMVRALSSEGRMTATILTALPVLAFVALFLLNPPFYLQVANDPAFSVGFGCLIVLYAVGFVIIRRLVNLKV